MGELNDTVKAAWSSTSATQGQKYIFTGVFIAAIFLITKIWTKQDVDSREPVLIKPKIPFVGHIINMALHQAEYLGILSQQVKLPIFRINVLGGQLYIVNDAELFQSVFRNSKTFSFDPLTAVAIKKVFQMPKRLTDLLAAPIPGMEDHAFPLHSLTNRSMSAALLPGSSSPILLMNARALSRFAQYLDPIDGDGISVELNKWLGHAFSIATSVGVFGPNSPVDKDPRLVEHVDNFVDSLALLMLGVAPSIIAAKAHAGREAYNVAFEEYYRTGGDLDASELIKGRKEVLGGAGFTSKDLASFDISIMLAATANSNPALLWFLSYVYSNPAYLASLREEVERAVSVDREQAKIDVSYLLKECPILVASWQEMLRTRSVTISSRIVLEDTLLNDQYLLRKNGVIQLVSGPNHSSTQIWGPDAGEFNPSRFLKSTQDNISRENRKQRRDGYTPFGGGSSLCPGRNFVTMEILGVVATFIVGYDITAEDGALLQVPDHKEIAFGAQIRQVSKDPKVRITRRKGWAGKKWLYDVGNGVGEGSAGLAFNSVSN